VPRDFGVIIPDGAGRIKKYVEKPTTLHLVSMGVYVFQPQGLIFIQPGKYLDFPDLVKLLLQAGHAVHYQPFSGYRLDSGRHEDYAQAAAEFEKIKVF
jgi:NDP-sugar pyrophosphorylase family protein